MFVYNLFTNNEQDFVNSKSEVLIMKIVNKKKFIRSIALIFSFIIVFFIILINKSFSHNDITYKKMYVSSGDTLWSIAKLEKNNNAYFEDKDIRDVVEILKTNNNLNSSNLKVGQELSIPII